MFEEEKNISLLFLYASVLAARFLNCESIKGLRIVKAEIIVPIGTGTI